MSRTQKTTRHSPAQTNYLAFLTLTALGVVYGDIGTSPLYAVRQCFAGGAISVTETSVLGVLSLIFWTLTLIVSLKYALYVLRADNRGEGGTLALMALLSPPGRDRTASLSIVFLALFGASLLYGDGMITPAISVLSAVEGLKVATPLFEPYIIPITIGVLLTLFSLQKQGTGKIGTLFGPVILVWFFVLAVLGFRGIILNPGVLRALDPIYALQFLSSGDVPAFVVLGGVFLSVTGAEALYADMGHFGRLPIRLGWFSIVLPALILNYFGQGALLLSEPRTLENPFFLLAPHWALIPLVGLSTIATVIASQAIISGAFSITQQAVHLGYLPRLRILHTSSKEMGQIYAPIVNRALLICTVGLVLTFRSASNLASAYGIAVSSTMVITVVMMFFVSRDLWKWKAPYIYSLSAALLLVDLAFFSANLSKIASGGWFPLLVAALLFTLMTTWRRGREILAERLREAKLPLESFVHSLGENPPARVPGTAIFLSSNVEGVPPVLVHHLKHNKTLHEQVVLMSLVTEERPSIEPFDRIQFEGMGRGFYRVIVHYGFMDSPNVPEALSQCRECGFQFDDSDVTYFLGRETLFATDRPGMAIWREEMFAGLSRNAESPTMFFKIPTDKVMEIGLQVEL